MNGNTTRKLKGLSKALDGLSIRIHDKEIRYVATRPMFIDMSGPNLDFAESTYRFPRCYSVSLALDDRSSRCGSCAAQ